MTPSSLTIPGPTLAFGLPAGFAPLPKVGSWELVRLAATGTLAEIYQARPVEAPKDQTPAYAVKMLRAQWRNDPRGIALLRREAVVGRTVAHPHLIAILAAGLAHPPYYLVMPWLHGATLDTRLATGRKLDLPVILWIARQVAEALDALHAAGWMHGDVKPANIHVSPERHTTLLDLGFARRRDEADSALTRCVMGSCAYLAPEMITSAVRGDIRSDLYSLGVVLFEMLTGQLPFRAESMAELVAQHKETRPPDLRELVPHLPSALVRLVHELLAKDQLRRPQTPREVIDQLIDLEIATFAERRVG
jgi:serine/threonine protein kinase